MVTRLKYWCSICPDRASHSGQFHRGAAIGAEVRCGDLREIDDGTFGAIRAAWHDHLVLLVNRLNGLMRHLRPVDIAYGRSVTTDHVVKLRGDGIGNRLFNRIHETAS